MVYHRIKRGVNGIIFCFLILFILIIIPIMYIRLELNNGNNILMDKVKSIKHKINNWWFLEKIK